MRGSKSKPVRAKKAARRDSWTGLRATCEFKAWLGRFAEAEYMTPGQLLGRAAAELAKVRGFEPAPPR